MSNYHDVRINQDGNWVIVEMLDNHFGPHQYGIRYPGGRIERASESTASSPTPDEVVALWNRHAKLIEAIKIVFFLAHGSRGTALDLANVCRDDGDIHIADEIGRFADNFDRIAELLKRQALEE